MRVLKILLCGLLLALPVLAEEADDRQTATSLHYVSHELDTRQDKLSTGSNKALTYTNSAGDIEQRTVKSDLTGGTTDTSLPMVNAVNAGLDSKQDDISTINDHTAVTYTGQTGQIGQKGIYQDSGTYAEQSDNLIDAKTFNAALKNGLDSEFICTEYKPGTDLCWLWQIHTKSVNLFDKNNRERIYGYFAGSGIRWNYSPVAYSNRIPCKPNTTYTARYNGNSTQAVLGFGSTDNDEVPTEEAGSYIQITQAIRQNDPTINTPVTLTTGPNDKWLIVAYNIAEPQHTDMANNLQIEQGSVATSYMPYSGNDGIYIPQN